MNKVLIHSFDSLRYTAEQMAETMQMQVAHTDSLTNAVEQIAQKQTVQQAQLDSIEIKIGEVADYGVGFSDTVSYIVFPLIIALFAFAFTYLFSVITRINEKYNSEHISDMFKTCMAYKCYMYGSVISVGYIIIMGAFSLALTGGIYRMFMLIMNWSGLVVAGGYAGIILWFVHTCLQYDNHANMLLIIENRFKKWSDRGNILLERTDSLTDLALYAMREGNGSLFNKVLDKVNELDKAEKEKKETNASFQTMTFYEKIVDGFVQYPYNPEIGNSFIWRWFQTFQYNRLPNKYVIYRMLGKLVGDAKQNRFELFENYVEKCGYLYDFITRTPIVDYIVGKDVTEQEKTDNDYFNLLQELREMHYLTAAYLFTSGHYEIAGTLTKRAGYNNNLIFPTSLSQVLKIYANCKEKQSEKTGAYYYWSLDKVIGHRYDYDILEKFTAFMLLVANQLNETNVFLIDDKKLTMLYEAKGTFVNFGRLWKKHADLLSLYPQICNVDISNKFDEGMKRLSNGELQEETQETLLYNTHKTRNIFDLKIDEQHEKTIRELFNTINIENITDGLNGDLLDSKKEHVTLGAYSFSVRKQTVLTPSIWCEYGVNEMEQVFKARYIHIIYEAISQMNIKDITVEWGAFEKIFLKHTCGNGDQFVILDNGCSMNMFVNMDMLEEGQKWSLFRHYKKAYYYDVDLYTANNLKDVPLKETFSKTIIVVRFADLPVLVPTDENGHPNVIIKDVSNKGDSLAVVRITADLCREAKFDKNAEVLRVRIKQ